MNQTVFSEVILVGFPGLGKEYYAPVSITMLLVYMVSVTVNGAVISLVIMKRHLHKPMYVIIANLAAADLLFDTITLPKMVARYWFDVGMTFNECLVQLFFFHFLNTTDSYIFMLMAIDRFFAICVPLQYPVILTPRVVAFSCAFCWLAASSTAFAIAALNSQAPPCGYNKINTLMCNTISLTALACKDVSHIKEVTFGFAMFIQFVPLSFIVLSYVTIINVIRLSASSVGLRRSFYTCSTHLFAVTLHYAPRVFVYTANEIGFVFDADVNVLVLCLYAYLPHTTNPVIYCLRNSDIRQTIKSSLMKVTHFTKRTNVLPNTNAE
ncbi:olfactory receptor 226-like [Gastrophryne carolinensis]